MARAWTRTVERGMRTAARRAVRVGTQAVRRALKPAADTRRTPAGSGDWIAGMAVGGGGVRRFRLYRPPGVHAAERLPLLVMLHGCGQDAHGFALSTRMNGVAARERFLVLYPEQDRLANAQGCWNWFDTKSGRARGEASLILQAIDQVCLLYPVARTQVAVAGLSAGASMAALLATLHPARFRAVAMHSGVPPWAARSTLSALRAMRGHALPVAAAPPPADAWPPLMVIHGRGDTVVSASNARTAVQAWADAAGARADTPRVVQRGKRHAMTVTRYKQGSRIASTLVEVDGLGHAWSGGAAGQRYSDGQGPDASRLIWSFVARELTGRRTPP